MLSKTNDHTCNIDFVQKQTLGLYTPCLRKNKPL